MREAAMASDVDDIGNCLTSLGIEKRHIIPMNVIQNILRRRPDFNQFLSEFNIFPLAWFDDGDSLNSRECNEGLAFLPDSSLPSLEINADHFEWRKVTVEKYDEKANKWRIKELESSAVYEVPGIYLLLIVEKPLKFAQRIQRAVQLRYECENRLKFDAAVDGIILSETLPPPQRLRDNIRKLLFRSFSQQWIQILEREHTVLFQKTLAAMELIKSLEKDPHSFLSIQLPTMEGRRLKNRTIASSGLNQATFKKSRDKLHRLWLYCCPEAIKIMEFINNVCDDVSRMSLFHIQTNAAFSLMEFVNANNGMLSSISDFLQRNWIEDVASEVRRQLAVSGKGWLDLNVNDWGIYRMSKLHRLIELMKQRIEVAVGLVLRSSLRAFVNHLCQPCMSTLNVAADFVWGDDLVNSCFHSPQPVFSIELDFIDGEPRATMNLDKFETEIIEMFKSRILTTHKIPQIDPYLVTQLKFDKSFRLSSIGFFDDEIQNQIFHLRRCYQTCLIPVRAYAQEYRRFGELMSRDNVDFVRTWKESNRTSKETKEKISHQLKSIQEIELTVPSTIVIGPFHINVSSMKKDLIAKCRDLFERLLLMFVDEVKEKLEEINENFQNIFSKLTANCETIEELCDIQAWMPDIPREVKEIQSKLQKMSFDFETLDFFLIVLSNDTFRLKISSLLMPAKIFNQIEELTIQHQYDFESFRKLQALDEVQFLQRIETLADEIEALSTRSDYDDLSKVSSEIGELWNVVEEMMTRGEMLNNRQKIFNQPEIDMERLSVFIERLHPHHTLLTMASNFLQSRDDWTFAPLSSVDINVVEAEAKRWESILKDSRVHFTSNAEMMSLIGEISKDIEAFGDSLDVMRDLKNPDFQEEHWEILSEKSGIPIEWTTEITLDSLLVRGIVWKAEIVKEVSIEATRARLAKEQEELEAERKRREEEEIAKQKKARRDVRKDI